MPQRRKNGQSAQVVTDLEYVFSLHPFKKCPPALSREITALKRNDSERLDPIRVIKQAMMLIPTKVGSKREEVQFALDLLIVYLANTGVPDSAWSVLAHLSDALRELDLGLVEPLLQPKKIGNRPLDSRFIEELKRLAAGGCEALIQEGESPRRAAGQVARWVNGQKVLTGEVSSSTILSWRKKFKKDCQFGPTVYKLKVRKPFLRPLLSRMDESLRFLIENLGPAVNKPPL
jgi:hypothetical protein